MDRGRSTFWVWLRRRVSAVASACRRWFDRHLGGTGAAVCQMGLLIAAVVTGVTLAAACWPDTAGYLLLSVAVLALLELAIYLAGGILRRMLGRSLRGLLAVSLLAAAVLYTVKAGAGEGWTLRVWLFSLVVTGVLLLLTASLWRVAVQRRATVVNSVVLALSLTLTAALSALLFTDGFAERDGQRFLALSKQEDASGGCLTDSLELGQYAVRTLRYGPEGDLAAGTVDITPYVSRDADAFTGSYVDAYLDYDLSQVPLQGQIWYPAQGESCPVLFIAHGNHEITTASYLGYAYLGEYLASHGYVVVSVDQNSCNMLTNENDGRAVLLLEHIGWVLGYACQADSPLFGRIDPESIAIAGHSRGGEMAATAYLFNDYDCYPENGTVKFDYHFNIRSLVAIAPTVNQYQPADHCVELEDVNYLLLHGAADRDVTDFAGMTQYAHITFTGSGDYLKSALYIARANHGQFNSLWGSYDQRGPFSSLLNVRSLLPEEEQQQIARIFIKVFLDVTLRGDDRCASLLTDWDSYAALLPKTVYYQCWERSGFLPIADFEEDANLETATLAGASISVAGVNWWTEELVNASGEAAADTHALRLRWKGSARCGIALPALDGRGRSVAFDICDLDSQAVEQGKLSLMDGEVTLRDASGNEATAKISDYATVYPILPVRTDKLDYLFHTAAYKSTFSTVVIPTEDFRPLNQPLELEHLTEIVISFTRSGQAAIDNIGLMPQ